MSPNNHIVLVPISARSHLRLLTQLALNLLTLHDSLVVTMLITSVSAPRLQQEINLQPKNLMAKMGSRFRVVSVKDDLPQDAGPYAEHEVMKGTIGPALEQILSGKGEARFATVPCLFISDLFRIFVRSAVKEKTTALGIRSIPVLQFLPTMAMAQLRFIHTTENHGATEKMAERLTENLAMGMEELEAARKAFRFVENKLLELPDLPPMYDYEFTPQATSRLITPMICKSQDMVWIASRDTDGVVCISVPEIDRASLQSMGQIQGVPTFGVGPQFNDAVWKAAAEEEKSEKMQEEEERIMAFLDGSLAEYGAKSAAYISFGTSFWPTLRSELVTAIIDSLLELDSPVPFIFATASPTGKVEPELKKRIEESGRGLVLDWAPQVRVLRHEAVGMFLTHCGIGSLTEAIVAGVPIIALPFAADQPALAAHFTAMQKIGIELYQLSSGNDGRTLGNGIHVNSTPEAMQAELRGAWKKMRGEEGEEYRRNVVAVRELMRKSWEEGQTREAMLRFADYFTEKV